jgi:hypothetical protein
VLKQLFFAVQKPKQMRQIATNKTQRKLMDFIKTGQESGKQASKLSRLRDAQNFYSFSHADKWVVH